MRKILPESENPALREIASDIPIDEIKSLRIRKLIAEMKSLLAKEEYGVALAAPQLGESIKIFIISGRALLRQAQDKSPRHPRTDYEDTPVEPIRHAEGKPANDKEPSSVVSEVEPDQIYINPEITKMSRGKKEKHEGCLSIRGYWGLVPRAEKATIRAYDEDGRRFTRGASGFLAHIFQHEMDHLSGILYTDKATEMYEEKEEKEKARD
ncbi:peptide deformylase [Candidatus Kaiserbacteria bacterium]|nr:peptide deformylase [Candidatus Kaiserbacteria bacterium]